MSTAEGATADEFDYFVTQVHIRTYGFIDLGDGERESERVRTDWTQIQGETLEESTVHADDYPPAEVDHA